MGHKDIFTHFSFANFLMDISIFWIKNKSVRAPNKEKRGHVCIRKKKMITILSFLAYSNISLFFKMF